MAEGPLCGAVRRLDLAAPAATEALAARFARAARTGDVIALSGALGTGKTVFARAFVNAAAAERGLPAQEVPSPTFTLVQEYDLGDLSVYHFDLYRLSAPEEAWELGIEDAFASGVSLIEWPDRLGPLLPADRVDLALFPGADAGQRRAEIAGCGRWAARIGAVLGDG